MKIFIDLLINSVLISFFKVVLCYNIINDLFLSYSKKNKKIYVCILKNDASIESIKELLNKK